MKWVTIDGCMCKLGYKARSIPCLLPVIPIHQGSCGWSYQCRSRFRLQLWTVRLLPGIKAAIIISASLFQNFGNQNGMSSLTTNCRRYFRSCMIVLLVLGVTEEEEEEKESYFSNPQWSLLYNSFLFTEGRGTTCEYSI